ncbi:MAG: hypothetical protein HKN80_14855 [Acidimicrobiia bacterium]|nr:hypothetical protein [Acidimicrobiia bacterium]
MDNFNPDLILDLAAGTLPEAEARAAEASLSPAGRAELEAQRAAMAAVAAAPPVGMTDIERAHLHRSVASAVAETTRELPPARVASVPAPARRSRSMAWMRWASVATAAAMFVGVVAVGSQLAGSGSSGDATADAPAAGRLTATTAAGRAGSDGGGGDVGAAEESFLTDTTAAPAAGDSSSEAGVALGADAEFDSLLAAPALDAAPADSDLKELTEFVSEAVDARRVPVAGVSSLSCYEVAAEDDDLDVVRGFLVPYPGPNGEQLTAIAFSNAGTEPLIRIYDLETCESLADNE